MRHRKSGIKLNRTASHRKAMFRNMVTSLFKYDRIQTTDAKAKELRSWADRLVTLAKRGDLHARRQALSIIREKAVVHKLFEDAPKRFAGQSGGYTRVVKIGLRRGDAAPMSLLELVSSDSAGASKTKKKKKPAKTEARKAAPAPAAEPVKEEPAPASADAGGPEADEAEAAAPDEAAPAEVDEDAPESAEAASGADAAPAVETSAPDAAPPPAEEEKKED